MSMYTNNIEAIAARVRDEYGAELAPLQNDYQRLDIWLTGWRSELLPESKRSWVHAFVRIAVMAVNSGMLAACELPLVVHELFFVEGYGVQLALEDRPAWERVCARPYSFAYGCSCLWCAQQTFGLPTPDASPRQALTPVPVSSPEGKPGKRRGRPPGAKDKEKRARKGELNGLTGAEKSKRCRNGPTATERKGRKELEKQQQQQTPPA